MDDELLEKIAALAEDEESAFRAGYFAKLASYGLTPSEFESLWRNPEEHMKKCASGDILRYLGLSKLFGGASSGLGMLAAATALPIGVGGLIGWGAADMSKPTNKDVKLMEQEALADTYDYHSRRLLGEKNMYDKKQKQMASGGARSMGLNE